MCCFNRRDITERIIHQVSDFGSPHFNIELVVVDDSSFDGTAEMLERVKKEYEGALSIQVVKGSGDLFWSKSMSVGERYVSDHTNGILWLNDDVDLYPMAFDMLNGYINQYPRSILVGQCYDPLNQKPSFGGFISSHRNPMKLTGVVAVDCAQPIDTFCGNFVYVPKEIAAVIGGIDGEYEHGLGDLDYGYRATRSGETALSLPGFIGECTKDDLPSFEGRLQSLRFWNSRKKSPIRSQIRFLRKFGGILWLLWFVAPYVRILLFGRRTRLD
jgi:GT2 family glycosyltransferase